MFEPGRFGIVLSDLYMPGLHGTGLIAAIRAIDPAVAIIALAGSVQGSAQDSLESALLAGADYLLDKPFDALDLLAAIEIGATRSRS